MLEEIKLAATPEKIGVLSHSILCNPFRNDSILLMTLCSSLFLVFSTISVRMELLATSSGHHSFILTKQTIKHHLHGYMPK